MKRTLAMLLALMTVLSLCAGCAKEPATPDPAPAPGPTPDPTPAPGPATPDPKPADPTPVTPPAPAEPFIYYYVRSSEETNLNPHDASLVANSNVVDYCAGMLYTIAPNEERTGGALIPVFADGEPTVDSTGYVWTIKLKKDGKWSDGEPITADDWLYSWKMMLDPNLYWGPGSSFGSNFITIKNAVNYMNSVEKKTGTTWEDVGLKKIDDYTIEVTTDGKYTAADVKRHFYMRYAGVVDQEIYQKCISADGSTCDYGSSLEKLRFAGQFYLTDWVKGAEAIFVKNENWPCADLIHIDKMISRVVTDESTRLELFEKGEASSINLGTNGMAKYGEDPRVISYDTKTIRTIEINHNHSDPVNVALFNDPEFRKALFYAIDRNAIAKLTDKSAAPFVLSRVGQILDDGTLYRSTAEAKAVVEQYAPNGGYDPEKAVQLLDAVYKKNGVEKLTITMHHTDSQRAASEFMDAEFDKIFGGKLNLDLKAVSSTLALMRESLAQPVDSWDLSWSGWSLDAENYAAWKKFEVYTSFRSNRYTPYRNAKLEEIYAECLKEENRLDDKKMLALTVEGEKALYEDMTCIPVYCDPANLLYQEYVQLPLENYVPGLGMGWVYSTKK